MPCYYPNTAYKTADGSIVFNQLKRNGPIIKTLTLACGQCHGCRLERSRGWAMRCVHEASLYKRNCFITLTYDDENLPYRNQLTQRDFELFMKRLRESERRKGNTNIRHFMGGEYGGTNPITKRIDGGKYRPHYHAILFNHDFPDRVHFKKTGSGENIDTSNQLSKLWPHGFSSVGNATFESAAYIARYCLQKVTGELAEEHYQRYDELGTYQMQPEYGTQSNKPGIGADWSKLFRDDMYTHDYVITRGHKSNIPKYYDKLFKRFDAEKMQQFKDEREWKAYQYHDDNTPERLAVKEIVAKAKLSLLKREL